MANRTLSRLPSADFLQNIRRTVPYAQIPSSQPIPDGRRPACGCRGPVSRVENGLTEQTLLGVTGSGKTFTMANIIERTQRPTLVLAHNKTLAAQLCSELREFFPHNAVEFFVSYYDYYQPEAYIASTTRILRRIRPSMTRSTACGTRRRAPCLSATTSSSCIGLMHLFSGRPDRLQEHGHLAAPGHAERPRRDAAQAHRDPVRAQRHCV